MAIYLVLAKLAGASERCEDSLAHPGPLALWRCAWWPSASRPWRHRALRLRQVQRPDVFQVHHWTPTGAAWPWNDPAVRRPCGSRSRPASRPRHCLVLGTLSLWDPPLQFLPGRDFFQPSLRWLLVLPLPCPVIVTGLALQSAFNLSGVALFSDLHDKLLAHATSASCGLQQCQRPPAAPSLSLIEPRADLGATPLQTFRLVTMPMLSTAIWPGRCSAFALSFRRGHRHHLHCRRAEPRCRCGYWRHPPRPATAGRGQTAGGGGPVIAAHLITTSWSAARISSGEGLGGPDGSKRGPDVFSTSTTLRVKLWLVEPHELFAHTVKE